MVFFMSSSLAICENINSMQYGSINAKLYNTVISYGILTILPCVFQECDDFTFIDGEMGCNDLYSLGACM